MENLFERELEIARRIQASFLPQELPQIPGWEIMGALSEGVPALRINNGRPLLPSTGTSALKNAMQLTNDYIANTHGRTTFATLVFGVLDPPNGTLLYVNGGHALPILVNSAGIKDQLATTGPLVGLISGARSDIRAMDIEPGETLAAFTDGVTEARNSSGEFFGPERLHALLARPASTAVELLDCIQASLQAFMNGAGRSDDITLLAVRRQ